MRAIYILAASILLANGAAAAVADPVQLYQLESDKRPVENGKVLDMQFREVERADGASTVEVIRTSGGSVSSSIFVLRGMCGLARARSASFFRAVPLSSTPMRLRVEFLETATDAQLRPVNPKEKVFSEPECRMLGF
ncbi:MAG TPA: hypothetical protein VFT37_08155 [Telluria sp.]|nr:hypothetical protein [Telluria sp.]